MAKIKLVVVNEAAAAKITEGALAARSTTTYVDADVSGEIWEGLNTRLVCRCCGVEKEVLITDDNLLNVPWECMVGGYDFYIGIYGCSGDGKVRVPTLWALVGKVGHSTGEAKITPNIPPSPSVVDQIIGITNNLNERVSDLEEHGGGVSGVSSVNGMTGDVELEIPTKTSELENDSGFLTTHQDLSAYALKDNIPDVPAWAMEPNKPTYTASEVGALPSDTVIPPAYDDSEIRGQIEKKYTKPEDGIPATDLADGVAPTVSVEDDGNIHRVTITDSTGSHEIEIKDGISTKVQIDYLGDKIFKHGDKTLNFSDLYDYHLTGPDFTFIVYGNRAYLCSFVDVDGSMKEMRFESVINSDLRTKVSSIYVMSTDGINISQVNVSDINSENSSNKIAEFTEANKNSTVNYPSNAAVNKELTELNKYITETRDRITGVSKVNDYLYNYTCTVLDYDYAADYFKSEDVETPSFSCSAAKSGDFFGRNFDWLYDDGVEFVVKTAAQNNYHATIGVAGRLPKLTKEFVESGYYDDVYKILPFMIADGINDSGVICCMNVVPMDYGETAGTISPDDNPIEICSLMLPRFVLDNFSSALEAVNYIRDHMSVYVPNKLHDMHYETHIMIADMHNAYAVEFINNQIEVIDITNRPYMTNFHLYDVTFNVDGSVYTPETMDDAHNAMITNGITQFGSGLERYNIIAANIVTSGSSAGMRELMDLLTYTNTYKRATTPFWYTEYVGGQNTVISTPDDFESVVDEYIGYYNDRQRGDGETWQTVHSAVYDIKNKTMTLREQEGDTDHIYSFNYYTKGEIDSQVSSINEDLSHKLTEPANMAVGKYFRIAAVDENGHAVLEAVDAPSGGLDKEPSNWPTWTAEEQIAGRQRLGLFDAWQLIENSDVNFETESTFYRESEPDGSPLNLRQAMIVVTIKPNATIGNYGQIFGFNSFGNQILRSESGNIAANTATRAIFAGLVDLGGGMKISISSNTPATPNNRFALATKFALIDGNGDYRIFTSSNVCAIRIYNCLGSFNIKIYGVRA